MPIYEFACSRCGAGFEELVRSQAEVPKCPKCGAAEVTRRLSQIFPTPRIGLRGRAARISDTRRAEREEKRREG
jgi:putative FmdB family regulatory protein